MINYETDPTQRLRGFDLKEMFPEADYSQYDDSDFLDVTFDMYGEVASISIVETDPS